MQVVPGARNQVVPDKQALWNVTRAALRSRRENKLAVDRYGERGPKQISSDKAISRHLSLEDRAAGERQPAHFVLM